MANKKTSRFAQGKKSVKEKGTSGDARNRMQLREKSACVGGGGGEKSKPSITYKKKGGHGRESQGLNVSTEGGGKVADRPLGKKERGEPA